MTTKHDAARTVTPPALLSPEEKAPLSAEDRLAIHELIARHCLVLDARDEAHLASVVTEDFKHEHAVFGIAEGRQGFAALLQGNPDLLGAIRHQAVNVIASGTGPNTAEAVHYTIVVQVHPVEPESSAPLPRLFAHGVVRDQLVKQGGQWLIQRRTYDQMSVGDLLPEEPRQAAMRRITSDWER